MDRQCDTVFDLYGGSYRAQNNKCEISACDNNVCGGALNCTNIEEPCKSYECKEGEVCRIGGFEFRGPRNITYAACQHVDRWAIVDNARYSMTVSDGTSCGAGGSGVCQDSECVLLNIFKRQQSSISDSVTTDEDREAEDKGEQDDTADPPVEEQTAVTQDSGFRCEGIEDCQFRGRCTLEKKCKCLEGYEGDDCRHTKVTKCELDCASLNRRSCYEKRPDICGPCLTGFALDPEGDYFLDPCNLRLQEADAAEASVSIEDHSPVHLFDDNANSLWEVYASSFSL